MGLAQGLALALVAASAFGLSLSAEFAGRSPFVQPPLAGLATAAATLLWLRGAPVREQPAVPLFAALGLGTAMWTLSAAASVALHLVRGQPFDFFEQFDSRPARALALVLAHAVFLGLPTGLVVGVAAAAFSRLRPAGSQGRTGR
jgi:hypothetical protein